MSAFYVGQRVRMARCLGNGTANGTAVRVPRGAEGVIVGFVNWPAGTIANDGSTYRRHANARINYDGYGRRGSHTDQLEPILPEGMESLADTLALWLPEGELV